jgi:hypothetical protein
MAKRLTFQDFITKSKEVHGDKYDYSESEYVNSTTPIKIICNEHGPFYQKPIYHYMGSDCPICAEIKRRKSKTKTTEKFIEEAKRIHGDKYDYSRVEYKGNNRKVCIICPEHGEFWIKPNNHLSEKQGCPGCGGTKKLSTSEFIKRAIDVHGDKYDYSKVNYVNSSTKVCIICHKKDEFGLEHGEFFETPKHHLDGHGCKKCSKNFMDTETFIRKSRKIHGDVYDYSQTKYVNSKEKVLISCKDHGPFYVTPGEHLRGSGCPVCNGSMGEKIIYNFLKNNSIKFEYQKTFEWLKNRKHMYIDFFIPKMNVAIEYQGKQHFTPVRYSNKTEKELLKEYKTIVKRDKIKEKLCLEHGINVEYISYTDDIIEKIKDIIYGTTN